MAFLPTRESKAHRHLDRANIFTEPNVQSKGIAHLAHLCRHALMQMSQYVWSFHLLMSLNFGCSVESWDIIEWSISIN